MARPGLTRHRKFLVLAQRLGNDALTLGLLEFMWETANESGDPGFPDAESLEAAARWRGEPGTLCTHLCAPTIAFVDPPLAEGGCYVIHDFWHHCPDYVRKRERREDARRSRTTDRSSSSHRPVTDRETAALPSPLSQHGEEERLPSAPPRARPRKAQKPDHDFETFYTQYPRHVGRADAEKAWGQTTDSRPALPQVLAALRLIDASEPQFIPHPATWLRAGRWADEKPQNGNGSGQHQPQRTAYNDRAKELFHQADAVEASDPELAAILREDAQWRAGIKPIAPRTED